MNIKEYLILSDNEIAIDKISIPNFTDDEFNLIESYLEFTRHIQEIDQLYRIFKSNLSDLLLHYEFKNSDIFRRKIDFNSEEDDVFIINALVINYISSGKTFTESIEQFINKKLDSKKLNNFKKNCLSLLYDKYFSYRLLIRLRDYAQHGHLPVSVTIDNKCSFDLEQIIYTPHFNHNKKLFDEMFFIKEHIYEKFKDNPRINFVLSIAEFQICIINVFISFIEFINSELESLTKKINNLISEKPNIVYKSDDCLNGLILYCIKDEYIQAFNPKDNFLSDLNMLKKQLIDELKKAKNEYNKLIKSYKDLNIKILD